MNLYKFKGVVKKIISDSTECKVELKGLPDYYRKFDEIEYNLLWDNISKIAKANELTQAYIVDIKDTLMINLFIACFINNKPIEITIEEKAKKYIIKSITALSN